MKVKTQPIITDLPQVYKTPLMRRIEKYNEGRDIRLIISDLYQKHEGNKGKVAADLQIDYTLLYQWIDRLGLQFEHSVSVNGQRLQEA